MNSLLLGAPMYINWNYTYRCNFNCVHCYSRTRTDIQEISFQDKMKIAENIVKNKVFAVNLGGGEPLLCEDCIDIIRFMASNHINVNLSTNGWKLSDDTPVQLKESGLKGVSVSIDHIDEKKHDAFRNCVGSFNEAQKSIQKYIKAGLRVYISTTITSQNYDHLEDILQFGESLGVYGIDFKRIKLQGNASQYGGIEISEAQRNKLYQDILNWKSRYRININLVYGVNRIPGIDAGCPCGKTALAIMNNGDISPCVYSVYKIGNAITDDLRQVWCHSAELQYMRQHFTCIGLIKGDKQYVQIER